MKELAYLNKYFTKYKWRLFFGVLFVALSNVFKVLSPRVLSWAIDMVDENLSLVKSLSDFQLKGDLVIYVKKAILIFIFVYFLMAVLGGLFTFLMRQTIIVVSRFIEFDLKNDIYKHYQVLDLAFYKKNNTGDLMNRATEDVSKVRMYLGPAIMYLINVAFLFTFVIVTMLSINVQLTIWVLLPMPFLTISIFYVNNIIQQKSTAIQEQLSNLTTSAQEYYSGIRVLKSYVQEKFAIQHYEKESETYKEKALDLAQTSALFFPLMILLVGLSTIIVVVVGGIYVKNGQISPGNIVEFIMYVNLLTWPVTSIGWAASLVQSAAASQRRINQFLHTQPEIDADKGRKIEFKGRIQFDNLSFTYRDTGIEALKNIDFEIQPGEKWAIMGKTGAGKSSVIELLVGLYYPTNGDLKIDDYSISELNLSHYRNQIAYIPQDVFLFSDTIMNNIKFGHAGISDEQAYEAAKQASIYNEIMEFPNGFNTIVGERGVTLSGGQKQRISIARALAMNPKVLIIDDALSAVDVHTEERIVGNLAKFIQDKTVIIVSHRIFKSLVFDQILVLDEGEIKERGTHEELVANKLIYAEFYKKQHLEDTENYS